MTDAKRGQLTKMRWVSDRDKRKVVTDDAKLCRAVAPFLYTKSGYQTSTESPMRTLSQQELNTVSGGTLLSLKAGLLMAPVKLAAGLLLSPIALIGSLFHHHGSGCSCECKPAPKPTCGGKTPPVDDSKVD
jgi:hypothetical protein